MGLLGVLVLVAASGGWAGSALALIVIGVPTAIAALIGAALTRQPVPAVLAGFGAAAVLWLVVVVLLAIAWSNYS